MRVVFVSPDASMYGSSQCLYLLVKQLKDDGWQMLVTCPLDGPSVCNLRALGVPVHIIAKIPPRSRGFAQSSVGRKLRNINTRLRYGLAHLSLYRQYRPDLVYVNTVHGSEAAIVAKLQGLPVIWHIHELGSYFSGGRGRIRMLAIKGLADSVIAVSHAVRKSLIRHGVRDHQICVVYNGISPRLSTQVEANPAMQVLPRDDVIVGTIGQITPRKGVHIFVGAAAMTLQTQPNVTFAIVGGASDQDQTYLAGLKEECIARGIAHKVIFAGYQADVAPWLARMDIVVLCSLEDPFPLIVLEAMAAAKPLVVTNSGGAPEAIENGVSGIVVPAGDPTAAATAISQLIGDDSLRSRLGQAALVRYLEFFTVERYVKNIQDIILRVASEKATLR